MSGTRTPECGAAGVVGAVYTSKRHRCCRRRAPTGQSDTAPPRGKNARLSSHVAPEGHLSLVAGPALPMDPVYDGSSAPCPFRSLSSCCFGFGTGYSTHAPGINTTTRSSITHAMPELVAGQLPCCRSSSLKCRLNVPPRCGRSPKNSKCNVSNPGIAQATPLVYMDLLLIHEPKRLSRSVRLKKRDITTHPAPHPCPPPTLNRPCLNHFGLPLRALFAGALTCQTDRERSDTPADGSGALPGLA
jgi:hypothetical protein